MKQTAVEWFSQELDKRHCVILNYPEYQKLLEQAKEMEKEQIENAFDNGWKRANETKDKFYTTAEDYGFNYYNETFKSE